MTTRQAVTVDAVRKTLQRLGKPAVARVVSGDTNRAPQATLSSFGDAPKALVQRHGEWITNRPNTLGSVNLIKAVVRNIDVQKAIDAKVRDRDPVSSRLTPSASLRLAKLGVSAPKLASGDGNSCRRESRPSDTKGDGGSRTFVPWCQKGKK